MNFILLSTNTTPTGRGLLQEDNMIYVLSACCKSKYTNENDGICSACSLKDRVASNWRTHIDLGEKWVKEIRHWRDWGLDLFGYKDFELHVAERKE